MSGLSFPMDPASLGSGQRSRAATFETPETSTGRKVSPFRWVRPGDVAELADLRGPGVVRHIWMTFPVTSPAAARSLWIEARYDGAEQPSVAVPVLDFFGLPHGRPVAFTSALAACQEGKGFNAYYPMPFRERLVLTLHAAASLPEPVQFFYQLDWTEEPSFPEGAGYLHVSWRRENPTVAKRDFVIADGLRGPGRFLGCVVGVRVVDEGVWYGEGEVKLYLDGVGDPGPTICGTGLEDYVGSGWGLHAHAALYGGAPLSVPPGDAPRFVGFYRWHVPDPVVFSSSCRVTIQQIGLAIFKKGEEAAFERYAAAHEVAGTGWEFSPPQFPDLHVMGIAERVDDYCAAAFLYTAEPQGIESIDVAAAVADLD